MAARDWQRTYLYVIAGWAAAVAFLFPVSAAIAIATGAMRIAVAVFEMKSP